jgi:tight adherence protein C
MVDKLTKVDVYGENATKNVKRQKQNEELALKLRKAGMHISVNNFNFFKGAFTAVVIVLSIGLAIVLYSSIQTSALYIVLGGLLIGLLGPNLYLSSKVTSHQNAIKAQLADTIDLMSVCMEAGLSFDASLVKISERMEGPFIDELMTVFKQIQLGKNRNEALKSMSDNSDIPELKTFVSAVIQANQMGIPITNVLQAQAEQLRMNKEEEIKEVAAKVPTKMTIPTVIFIMPTIFVIILGPVMFNVADSLSGAF